MSKGRKVSGGQKPEDNGPPNQKSAGTSSKKFAEEETHPKLVQKSTLKVVITEDSSKNIAFSTGPTHKNTSSKNHRHHRHHHTKGSSSKNLRHHKHTHNKHTKFSSESSYYYYSDDAVEIKPTRRPSEIPSRSATTTPQPITTTP
jgi:hypothetical protein